MASETNTSLKSSLTKWIDYTLLIILSAVCLKYITYSGRSFAETSVKVSFLNFPIFVGEFFLTGCLILFFIRLWVSPIKVNRWHYAVILFFIFVLIKAFVGYRTWGPLALRDAALFYYTAFGVISYVCYGSTRYRSLTTGSECRTTLPALERRCGPGSEGATRLPARQERLSRRAMNVELNTTDLPADGNVSLERSSLNNIQKRPRPRADEVGACTWGSSRPNVFNKWIILVLYAALFWLPFDSRYNEYWLIPRIFIGFALAYKFPDWRVGVLMALGVLLSTPYEYFLNTSRSLILGNFVAVSFLFIFWPMIADRKTRVYFAGGAVLILLLLGAYVFHFSGYRPAQGLLAVDKLNRVLNEMQQEIDSKRSSFKKREVETVMIYSPEQGQSAAAYPVSAVDPQPALVSPSQPAQMTASEVKQEEDPSSVDGMKLGNSVFRILLWKDALGEIVQQKKIFGIDLGKPFRSQSLEIIRAAADEWQRDGWIAMHNSYLNLIYRGGVVGVLFIIAVLSVFFYMVRIFVKCKSVVGILLCASMLVPFVVANFAVTLELPYTAIPIWSLFGLTLAYAHHTGRSNPVNHTSKSAHAHSHCP